MKLLPLSVILVAVSLPALAQAPDTAPPPSTPPPSTPEDDPKPEFRQRVFFGGGVGLGFGTIDYATVSPMVGFHVVPRLDLGIQPFYRWTQDGRYSPTVTTNDYGVSVFARVPVIKGFFVEADYEYSNYEYPTTPGATTRATHDAFLAGGGYVFPVAPNVGVYASALYEFTYDADDPFRPYDSPVRYQAGVSVGF